MLKVDQIDTRPLQREPWVQIHFAPQSLNQYEEVSLNELTHFDAVLPGFQTFTRGIVENAFARENQTLNVALSTNYMETLKMMVSIGLGWSLLPDTLIDDSMNVIPLPDVNITRPLGYLFHKERTLSNAGQKMIAARSKMRA